MGTFFILKSCILCIPEKFLKKSPPTPLKEISFVVYYAFT